MKAIKQVKMITMGCMSFFIMGTSNIAWAQVKSENPVELNVVGKRNNSPLLELKAINKDGIEYVLKVKDAEGSVLYSETLHGQNILRKYQLDINEVNTYDNLDVLFEITSVATGETFKYTVSRSSRLVEDIMVAKL